MKKIISVLFIILLLFSNILILAGCGKKNNNQEESKYNLYELEASFGGKLTFEIGKDSGYECTKNADFVKLYNKANKSSIEMFIVDSSKGNIIMNEEDFSTSVYKDYKQMKINDFDAFSITYHAGSMTRIEMGILLYQHDKENNKNYGLKIRVSQDPTDSEGLFNPEEYVKSEEFQHLLNSIRFTNK